MKERFLYIDALKVFAIFLVVLGHIAQHYLGESALLTRSIFSFHIPLFIFISGYLNTHLNDWGKVWNRFKKLMIPFFSYGVVIYFIKIGTWDSTKFVIFQLNIYQHPDNGLWFLWALFFIIVLYLICRRLSFKLHINEKIILFIMAAFLNLIVLVTGLDSFGFHWIAWYFIYFCLGAYFVPIHRLLVEYINKNALFLPLLLIVFLCMAFNFKMHNEAPLFYSYVDLGSRFPILYRLIVGALGSIVLFELFAKIVPQEFCLSSLVCEMGGATLGVYYIHFIILHVVYRIFIYTENPHVLTFATSFIVFTISYVFTKIAEKYKYLRLLILGK